MQTNKMIVNERQGIPLISEGHPSAVHEGHPSAVHEGHPSAVRVILKQCNLELLKHILALERRITQSQKNVGKRFFFITKLLYECECWCQGFCSTSNQGKVLVMGKIYVYVILYKCTSNVKNYQLVPSRER